MNCVAQESAEFYDSFKNLHFLFIQFLSAFYSCRIIWLKLFCVVEGFVPDIQFLILRQIERNTESNQTFLQKEIQFALPCTLPLMNAILLLFTWLSCSVLLPRLRRRWRSLFCFSHCSWLQHSVIKKTRKQNKTFLQTIPVINDLRETGYGTECISEKRLIHHYHITLAR